ncbi:MAG: hypothetical protein OES46_14655 [Gammaproteobacteria bacterium]|nr:hypothetical protein [Gammaproteobacteria bacterium]
MRNPIVKQFPKISVLGIFLLATWAIAPVVFAGSPDDGDNGSAQILDEEGNPIRLVRPDPSAPLMAHDAATANIISSGPSAKVIKNLQRRGRGERLVANATTDVWALGGFAYTGTFNNPCGGNPGAGIFVWDVHNHNQVTQAAFIPSPVGSRSNDVKVASMNSGDILVHSNESCAGGVGGFEIYNVDDPTNPVFLAHVQVDEIAEITPLFFGGPGSLDDNGVHNLWLFTQGGQDYVAAQSEGVFDGFQIYDITDPTNPSLVSGWGAEEVFDPGVGDLTLADDPTGARTLDSILWLLGGFGASQNRFLHDFTITPDGTQAYLAHWDAGLILLDISDVTNPQFVSLALDTTASDGEVNSHAVWPSEDGTIVVETEEDFAPFETVFMIDTGPAAGQFPATEGAITTPIVSLPGQAMTGPTTYVGFACDPGFPGFDDPVPVGSGIALIQRGACTFTSKINNAIAAGYSGVVMMNDAARGDALVVMGGTAVDAPGVFVGHSTGLAIAGVATAADLVIGASGEDITASAVPNGWGDIRIWDYSDPANPVLASIVNTVCSANPTDASCDPAGTYSVHNVVVETTGNKTKAYISWYWDGMLIFDITDPYNPVEVARFFDNSPEFLASNGGNPHDFWGVYKQKNLPWIYGSDRNGGLYVFKEQGAGSANKGKP